MRRIIQIIGILITTSVVSAVFAAVPPLQTRIVASGLDQPLFLTAPAGDSRLFIVEKGGAIKILQNGGVLSTPFLDLSRSVDTEGERGLVGMAFDPNFADNRRFYVNYIDKATLNTVVATYQADASRPNIADPASGQTILTVEQSAGSVLHKAGWMGFRPGEANNLYIATGDGGGGPFDPLNRAQSLNYNLGKILRVDVSADRFPDDNTKYGYAIPMGNMTEGNPEIYAYGLRNPFRNSFDRETGTFYIADVGESTREEIDIGSAGANYGWRTFEGTHVMYPDDPPINHTLPIYEYDHNGGHSAVIGGYVYRGSAIDGLEGTYFFTDIVTGEYTSFRYTGTGITELTDRSAELVGPNRIFDGGVSSFGEDSAGNLYLISFNGQVGMITAVPEPAAWAMTLAGMVIVTFWARRRRKTISAMNYTS